MSPRTGRAVDCRLTKSLRLLATLLLGVPFIAGGLAYRTTRARRVAVARRMGIPAPERAVVVDAAIKLVGGTLLALNICPRILSAVLAADLIPTTVGAHGFWRESHPEERERMKQYFILNCAVFGGLMVVSTLAVGGNIGDIDK